jgi:DNA-binding NtrC family response regulator
MVMRTTASRTEAMKFLRQTTRSIVLCDRDLQGCSWQQTMLALLSVRRHTCFILLSSVEESNLRNEVVYKGGFDILVRPFRKEQVLSLLIGASSRHGGVTLRVPI